MNRQSTYLTAILKTYGFDSRKDHDDKVENLQKQLDEAEKNISELTGKVACLLQTQQNHNKEWTNLFAKFVDSDVALKNITPILERSGLLEPSELHGTAGNSTSFLADEYFSPINNELKDARLALFPSSTIARMLAVAMSRRPVATDAIDDLQVVQAGLRSIRQSMDVEPTRTEQELFIKMVLIWLHNVLDTETSGLRLAMGIGLLTGILDIIDPNSIFWQSFPSQLGAQLFKGLLAAAMTLRCMRRMQYTPDTSASELDTTHMDSNQTIPRIAIELYQNNKESFSGDYLFLSDSVAEGTYTSMTLIRDDPRHRECILFERANRTVAL